MHEPGAGRIDDAAQVKWVHWREDASIAVLALAGFTFVIAASYPGYLDGDSLFQLNEALTGQYGDWHSPTIGLLWSLLLKISPGPVGFLIFGNVLIWASLAALVMALRRRVGISAYLLLLIPLSPGAVNLLGNVNTDVLLAAWLMGGSALAYLSARDNLPRGTRLTLQIAANLFLIAAFLTRPNAIFCLVPLLLYVNGRMGLRRNLILSAGLLVAMPVIYSLQNSALGVTQSHPSDSIKTYHLLALSYYEGRNLFPGKWTELQSQQIVQGCYSPVQWDTASSWGQCSFIARELNWQHIWGTDRLTRAWLTEVLTHPLKFYCALTPTFRRSMHEPNSRQMLYRLENRWNWIVEDNPRRASTAIFERYITSPFNDKLGRPWLFGLYSLLGIALNLRLRLYSRNEGRFALALLLSGLVFTLTFFVFNVSAEYRYFYWSAFAAYLGLFISLIMGALVRWRPLDKAHEARFEATVRKISLLTCALGATLIFFPYKQPTYSHDVVITPLDSRPIRVLGIHNVATPKWMAVAFEGELRLQDWYWVGPALEPHVVGRPLIATMKMLRENIEVVLAAGPGMGAVIVDGAGFHRVVNTDQTRPGTLSIVIPPTPESTNYPTWLIRRNTIWSALFFVAVFIALSRLCRPGRRAFG